MRNEPTVLINIRKTARVIFAVAVCLSLPAISIAGGFDAPSISARGAGMGGALVALTGNLASAYVNPASLSYLRETEFSIGTTVMLPNFRFAPSSDPAHSTKMQAQVLFPPNLCITHTFNSGFGVGVAVTIPYSMKTDWGTDWVGRNIIASSELRGFVVTPMASFQVSRSIAVGFGLNITSFRLTRSARIAASTFGNGNSGEGTESMQGTNSPAYGVRLGMLFAPIDGISFGLAYKGRSKITIDEGTVSYAWPERTSNSGLPTTAGFVSDFTLPDRLHAGVALNPFDFFQLTGEIEYVRWSTIDNQMISVGSPVNRETAEQRDWRNSLCLHAGAELVLGDITLRAGVIFDRSPVNDSQLRPSVPDADRSAITVGIGYQVGEGLMLDFALQSVRYAERTITTSVLLGADGKPLNGTYTLNATVVGLNLSYSWN